MSVGLKVYHHVKPSFYQITTSTSQLDWSYTWIPARVLLFSAFSSSVELSLATCGKNLKGLFLVPEICQSAFSYQTVYTPSAKGRYIQFAEVPCESCVPFANKCRLTNKECFPFLLVHGPFFFSILKNSIKYYMMWLFCALFILCGK